MTVLGWIKSPLDLAENGVTWQWRAIQLLFPFCLEASRPNKFPVTQKSYSLLNVSIQNKKKTPKKPNQNKTNSMHMLSFLCAVKGYLFFEEQTAEKLKVPLDLSALVYDINTFGCVPCLSAHAEYTVTDAFPSSKFLQSFFFIIILLPFITWINMLIRELEWFR